MTRALAVVCAFALGAGSGNAPQLWLRVRTGAGIVWSGRIHSGEAFDIAFRHSSEHCTWTQHFTAGEDATVRQVSSTFPCYGPGMPSAVPEGTKLRVSADGFTVAAPLVLHELQMMASRRADLYLHYRSSVVPLGAMLREFDLFTVTVEP